MIERIIEESKGDFVAREKKELVRNCTKLPENVRQTILDAITIQILKTENFQSFQLPNGQELKWNLGGKIPLKKCHELLDRYLLDELKQQFGGLQTFVRNHHHIFQCEYHYSLLLYPSIILLYSRSILLMSCAITVLMYSTV